MLTTEQGVSAVVGLLVLFLVWEYAPPAWGGWLLLVLTLAVTMKALDAVR